MTKFIDVSKIGDKQEKRSTVFTYYLSSDGSWKGGNLSQPNELKEVTYLGRHTLLGDLFVGRKGDKTFDIYKGVKGDEFE